MIPNRRKEINVTKAFLTGFSSAGDSPNSSIIIISTNAYLFLLIASVIFIASSSAIPFAFQILIFIIPNKSESSLISLLINYYRLPTLLFTSPSTSTLSLP